MMLRALAIIAVLLLATGTAAAGCGDNGDAGYRGPSGQCVGWCDLARVCGSSAGAGCTPENPSRILLTLQAVVKGDPSLPRCRGCGCKGGPGYRAANGSCVGWDALERTCGSPPTLRCRAEIVAGTAAEVAEAQQAYAEHLRACRKSP